MLCNQPRVTSRPKEKVMLKMRFDLGGISGVKVLEGGR